MISTNLAMVKTRELTEFERTEIIRLHGEGKTYDEIRQQLRCAKGSITYTLRRYDQHHTIRDLHRVGRRRISTARDQRSLLRMVKKDRTQTSTELARQWMLSNNQTASPRTVRKILQDYDYMWRPACPKPRLTENHVKQRLKFCKEHRTWTKRRWRDVIFSDEMNVEVDNRKNRIMLRRTIDEKFKSDCLERRRRQGSGSIGIWACLSYDGVKFFKLYKGRLNAESYQDILGDYLLPSLDLMEEKEFAIFQQDNAPCHSANVIKDFLVENKIQTLQWPANSPDLSCIENLWSWLDGQLAKIQIGDVDHLEVAIRQILSNVPLKVCHDLVDSMPARITECIREKGEVTHY